MRVHWRGWPMNHPRGRMRLRLILVVLAGTLLICASGVLVYWKGHDMSEPGFDPPEGDVRGREDAAVPYPKEKEPTHAASVKEKHEVSLMAMDGVEGVGIGRGLLGDEAIIVYVRDQQAALRVPKELDGVPVQVQVTGRIEAQKRK